MNCSGLITLVAACLLTVSFDGICHPEEAQKKISAPQTQISPSTPIAAKSKTADTPSVLSESTEPQKPVVQPIVCCTSQQKADERWGSKDVAGLLSGIAGLLGAGVAALAIGWNGRTTRATTIQKANEAELAVLDSKLDKFYGPYLQLSSTNRLISTELKSRQLDPDKMRILLVLVDPRWREKFSAGDVALIDEIVSIDEALLKLIQEVSGLTSNSIQPYLWRAASHFRMMILAHKGKLDNDLQRYESYVYPRQLDEVLELEIARIHSRIDAIRRTPMELHPPPPELQIPKRLELEPWPGKNSSFKKPAAARSDSLES
jgi:hypothetical protein